VRASSLTEQDWLPVPATRDFNRGQSPSDDDDARATNIVVVVRGPLGVFGRYQEIVHHWVLLKEDGWAREEKERTMRREEDKEDAKSRERRGCWYIAVDTLSTLGSLFSSIPPYLVVRDSGT
jgi:hypothetical protein